MTSNPDCRWNIGGTCAAVCGVLPCTAARGTNKCREPQQCDDACDECSAFNECGEERKEERDASLSLRGPHAETDGEAD